VGKSLWSAVIEHAVGEQRQHPALLLEENILSSEHMLQ